MSIDEFVGLYRNYTMLIQSFSDEFQAILTGGLVANLSLFFVEQDTGRQFEILAEQIIGFLPDSPILKHLDPIFPHTCPTCKSPAYIGFSVIDCSKNCEQRKL